MLNVPRGSLAFTLHLASVITHAHSFITFSGAPVDPAQQPSSSTVFVTVTSSRPLNSLRCCTSPCSASRGCLVPSSPLRVLTAALSATYQGHSLLHLLPETGWVACWPVFSTPLFSGGKNLDMLYLLIFVV